MLLDSFQFSRQLRSSIDDCNKSILLASAFIKTSAIGKVLRSVPDEIAVNVVARWQPNDLLHSASDLSTYTFCKEKGWRFGVSLNFHGKVYVFDRKLILLGSANLTNRGLALSGLANFEFGTMLSPREQDICRLDRFLEDEVVWLNDNLFEMIEKDLIVLRSFEPGTSKTKDWPSATLAALYRPVSYLWVKELPFCSPIELLGANFENDAIVHDFELLSLDIDQINQGSLMAAFKRSRAYRWLHTIIEDSEFCSFGKLSSELHNAILDDPTPYRRDIKDFVVILFCWLELMPMEFELVQHRRTRSVRARPNADNANYLRGTSEAMQCE